MIFVVSVSLGLLVLVLLMQEESLAEAAIAGTVMFARSVASGFFFQWRKAAGKPRDRVS